MIKSYDVYLDNLTSNNTCVYIPYWSRLLGSLTMHISEDLDTRSVTIDGHGYRILYQYESLFDLKISIDDDSLDLNSGLIRDSKEVLLSVSRHHMLSLEEEILHIDEMIRLSLDHLVGRLGPHNDDPPRPALRKFSTLMSYRILLHTFDNKEYLNYVGTKKGGAETKLSFLEKISQRRIQLGNHN